MSNILRAAAAVAALFLVDAAQAATPLAGSAPATSGTWLTWGGEIEVRFNPDALVALGMAVEDVAGAVRRTPGVPGERYESMTFRAREDGVLEFRHVGNKIGGIGGGALTASGGFALRHGDARSDLRGLRLRAAPGTRFDLELVDAQGTALFTADHAHYGFDDAARTRFGMRNMNLRIAPALAARIGQPAAAGRTIGGLAFSASASADTAAAVEGGVCNAPWPTAGMATDVRTVFRLGSDNWTGSDDSVEVQRCRRPNGGGACTGASTDGSVVISPDSSLVNVGETAVSWHGMFSGDYPPYGNDQHPFLIWNLYRIDGDGSFRQIGASGVKHAFLTINFNCSCGSGNVIYPTCEDTYSSYNNDQTDVLGPRSEIVPYTAKWGRCGSRFDPNCDGDWDGDGATGLYDQRMNVRESDLQAIAADAAKYYFEYWYVVRDDENIYNTMGHRQITASKSAGGSWNVALVGAVAPDYDFTQGPVINRWVNPVAPGENAANQELSTPLGRARIAVKATDLGNGQWRYRYALMNFDYAHVDVDPAHATEPNLKLTASVGFDRFAVPLPGEATDVVFVDADHDASNDWTAATVDGSLVFTAPANASLAWGMLARFEFTTDAPPASRDVAVRGGATPNAAALDYTQALLAPRASPDQPDLIFADDFE